MVWVDLTKTKHENYSKSQPNMILMRLLQLVIMTQRHYCLIVISNAKSNQIESLSNLSYMKGSVHKSMHEYVYPRDEHSRFYFVLWFGFGESSIVHENRED